ncbi:hypothetical protein [Mesonia aestuariivivens]|uniref:Viral A-type inclusion protein n=1 Tax=Mesonia aestuariivivens TaxID=2796128 RepID=A0ABS6VZF4_9FLAO|nr:hypothetical protein [Mesonia aestuariivivens]MBW2960976.1 hypothetical protein [Mesonia aestuariivivens]
MKKTLVFIFSVLLLISCGKTQESSKEKKNYDQSIAEILEVHDEVMPKMGTLSSLIEETEAKVDTTAMGIQFKAANNELKEAHHFMMNWMKDFSEKFPNALKDTTYSKEVYKEREPLLMEEKEEVKEMQHKVNNSIEKAKELLKKTS